MVTNRYPQNNYMTRDSNMACIPVIYHNKIFDSQFDNDFYVKTTFECLLEQPVRDFNRQKNCDYQCLTGESCVTAILNLT